MKTLRTLGARIYSTKEEEAKKRLPMAKATKAEEGEEESLPPEVPLPPRRREVERICCWMLIGEDTNVGFTQQPRPATIFETIFNNNKKH